MSLGMALLIAIAIVIGVPFLWAVGGTLLMAWLTIVEDITDAIRHLRRA